MRTLIVATKNKGKLKEIRDLLKDLPVRVRSLADYSGFLKIVEDGRTFRANALKKALMISRCTGALVVGEDSGIEVEVLGGRPGVHSARYAGEDATDRKNNLKLLRHLRGLPPGRRGARYRCVAVLAEKGRVIATVSGSCRGVIAERPQGTNGFGYDPLFFVPKYHKTFGQLDLAVKAKISHRARAMKKIRKILEKYFFM